jgi:hypothetical protein
MVHQPEGKRLMKDSFMFVSIQWIRTGPQSTLIFIATVVCLGLALLLIAATIVLALIPVFISNKSVSANSSME